MSLVHYHQYIKIVCGISKEMMPLVLNVDTVGSEREREGVGGGRDDEAISNLQKRK